MNYLKTGILLAGMTALFMAFGYMLGGEGGMLMAFGVAAPMNWLAYWRSGDIVLRMYRAKEVTSGQLYYLVEELAARAELPMPKVCIIENQQPNAFATGRNPDHGAVAVTTGLMRMMNEEELAAVVAHELAHIRNRDTLIMTVTATLAGAISMLANFALFFGHGRQNGANMIGMILLSILAPMAAMLVQMAISRTREYGADRGGAEICGNPMALASALAKLEQGAGQVDNVTAEEHPATAHMFIINPLHMRSMDNLFATHPATRNRIEALKAIAAEMGVRETGASAPKGPWG